ncbi:hypothetical protein [Niabella aurantiaca]|uniref:hypothetical protein n=1 Tax=Niabella aurantiaca TaxID=379900 RepID=UPI00035CD507|nr:hypothetical protein [Niabella aurantiaca]
MFADYTNRVLQDYEQKRTANRLPINLSAPTPARLRDECLIVCRERWQRRDEKTLRDFFDQAGDQAAYLRLIRNCDIDRFRPLSNFLKKQTISTDDKNILLLAWLTGFEPFESERNYDGNSPEDNTEETTAPAESTGQKPEAITGDGIIKNDETKIVATSQPPPMKPKRYFKAIIIPVVLAVLAGVFLYLHLKVQRSPAVMGTVINNREACMYWTGDHYRQISCSQKVYGAQVIALDTEQLVHFKKITRPDTITAADINRIAYIRLNGNIEFYTRMGNHPVYPERNLRPLSEHIYEKHILPLKH